MPLNADQLLAVFPHPVLTKIVGEPTLESLSRQQSEHNGNLASIQSNLGDGLTGLLILSLKPSVFTTIHPDPFEVPTNPGSAPSATDIAAATSATKIADLYKEFDLKLKIYSEFFEAERISVKLSLESIDPIYYQALKHEYTAYAKVTLRQLLDHLFDTYANIDQFDLETNYQKMTARYDPNSPIESLFEQISDGTAFAALGNAPFSPKQIVDSALLCVAKTGVFHDDVKDWNRTPSLDQTWPNFQVHFAKAHREWKANLKLTTGTHFPRANAVIPPALPAATNETVEALANLATATAADRATVATLTDTIAQLSSELASAQAKLISSLLDNQKLLSRLSNKGGPRNPSGGEPSGGASIGLWDGPCIHYCHTCGYKCPHPSFKCPVPTASHIKNATKKDIRGGKTTDYKKT